MEQYLMLAQQAPYGTSTPYGPPTTHQHMMVGPWGTMHSTQNIYHNPHHQPNNDSEVLPVQNHSLTTHRLNQYRNRDQDSSTAGGQEISRHNNRQQQQHQLQSSRSSAAHYIASSSNHVDTSLNADTSDLSQNSLLV